MKPYDPADDSCGAPYCRKTPGPGDAVQYQKDGELFRVCWAHWQEIVEKFLWIFLIVPYFLLGGCFLEREENKPNAWTPNGYGVITPAAFDLYDEFTQEQALEWVDLRIASWIESRSVQYGLDTCTAISYDTTYELIDDCRFVEPSSPTHYANGSHSGEGPHYVKACLYAKAESDIAPETVPYPGMGPWYMNGLWKWGVFPSDGVGFAVIGHELDHALGIDHP